MNKTLKFFLKLLLSLVVLVLVLRSLDIDKIIESFASLNVFVILISFFFCFSLLFFMTYKWKIFIDKIENHSLITLYKIYWASDFMGLFNLGSLGSEAYKMFSFGNKKYALALSLMDKIYSFLWYFLLFLSVFTIYSIFQKILFGELILALFLFYFFVFIYIYSEGLILKSGLISRLKYFKKLENVKGITKKRLLKHATIALLFKINAFIFYSIILFAVGVEFNLLLLLVLPLITILTTLPISFQGLGMREYLLLMYANFMGYDTEAVVLASFLIFTVLLFFRMVGFIPFLILKPKL